MFRRAFHNYLRRLLMLEETISVALLKNQQTELQCLLKDIEILVAELADK